VKLYSLILSFCFAFHAQAKIKSFTVLEAIQHKLIIASAYSNGLYKGQCMLLQIQNLSSDSILILAKAGQRFISKNDKEQDILIVKDERMLLAKKEKKTFFVKGYCCQASHKTPTNAAKYQLPQSTDKKLEKLALYLNSKVFCPDIEQQAVWVVSDNHAVSFIPDSSEALQSLRYLVANLSGQKIPWYSIEKHTYVTASGIIKTVPLFLCGTLTYSSAKNNYITCKVLSEDGLPVAEIKSQWLSAGLDQKYKVRIPVKHLKKGEYTVHLCSSENTLAMHNFEI
jgi:hypothetical protein